MRNSVTSFKSWARKGQLIILIVILLLIFPDEGEIKLTIKIKNGSAVTSPPIWRRTGRSL
jgi:hypothetical protein